MRGRFIGQGAIQNHEVSYGSCSMIEVCLRCRRVLAEYQNAHTGPSRCPICEQDQSLPEDVRFKMHASKAKLNRHITRNHKMEVDQTEGSECSGADERGECQVGGSKSRMGVGLMNVPFFSISFPM